MESIVAPRTSVRSARPSLGGVLALVGSLALACSWGSHTANEPELSREGLPTQVLECLDVVEGLQAAMIAIMKQGPELGYAGRFAAIEAIARVSFDIPTMARASYGPDFSNLTPAQQAQWIAIYERFHISSLADVRDRYRGQSYRILAYDELGPDLVLIRSKLDFPGRAVDLYTDYRLRRTNEGWRIIDVHSPPSVSEVAMRRAEYLTVLERGGFDGLIDEMQTRIERRERR